MSDADVEIGVLVVPDDTTVNPTGDDIFITQNDGSTTVSLDPAFVFPTTYVSSFNTRGGAVLPAAGDYAASQITFAPVGTVTATDAQAAIAQLDANTTASLALKAPLASPTFTGVPAAPTAAPGTNTTQLATTAFVAALGALKADLASPTFTGDPKAPTPGAGDADTSIATTAFVDTSFVKTPATNTADKVPQWNGANSKTLKDGLTVGTGASNLVQLDGSSKLPAVDGSQLTNLPAIPFGGQLNFANATTLTFTPKNGDRIKINGTVLAIPSGGITGLSNTGVFVNTTGASNLGANTTYLVCAFSNGGTVTADFFTTLTHLADTTAGNVGVEIPTSFGTRTVIGMIRTNGSSQFADTAAARFVASWFNRKNRSLLGASTAGATSTSLTSFELTTASRVEFVSWADEAVQLNLTGEASNNTVNAAVFGSIGIDSATSLFPGSHQSANSAANNSNALGGSYAGLVSDNYHYATPLGWVASNTGTFHIGLSGIVRS